MSSTSIADYSVADCQASDGLLNDGTAACRWGSSGTAAPGPGAYDQSTLSMQKEVEKMTTNTTRHAAFGVGERFVKPKPTDSAAVSHLVSKPFHTCLLTSSSCHRSLVTWM